MKYKQNNASKFTQNFMDESGAVTAEYAIIIMAAVGFAGLMVAILKGDAVKSALTDLVTKALSLE